MKDVWVLARQMGDMSRVLGNEKRLGKGTKCETAGALKGAKNSPVARTLSEQEGEGAESAGEVGRD